MSKILKYLMVIFSVLLIIFSLAYFLYKPALLHKNSIKIGILCSIDDTYINEQPVANVALMVIDEINAQGGVLGRQLEAIVVDGKDNEALYAQKAHELIEQHHVAVIFCSGSCACRKSITPIVEASNTLLFYASPAEGLEESPVIIYTNSLPNQSIIPLATWAFSNLGTTFFIVGSDRLLSQVSNEMIKKQALIMGATLIGEEIVHDNEESIKLIINKIVETKPKIILNTIYGKANITFYKQLRAAGITSENIPTLSLMSDETELKSMPEFIGDYAVAAYLEAVDRPENKKFIENYQKRYGPGSTTTSTMASSYINVNLWRNAVEQAQSIDITQVMPILLKQVFNGPGNIVYLDKNHYAWRPVLIAKALFNQQFTIVWNSLDAIHPEPYPAYQDKALWKNFLMDLYKKWGNAWSSKA